MTASNVFWQHSLLNRWDREQLTGHKSRVIWFTGLSGSGKTTLAQRLEKTLYDRGIKTYLLDGDNIRFGLNKDLGFSEQERTENIRRVAEVAKLMVDAGLVVITAFITPLQSQRNMVRALFVPKDFDEIYVKCSLEACEARDVKGLYRRARMGEVPNFTGISAPYEIPEKPELQVDTEGFDLQQCLNRIESYLYPEI